MEADKLRQLSAAIHAFAHTEGQDESLAAILPADMEFARRLHNLNHFRTAFAWSLEDWILEQCAGDEQWGDLAEILSWADDDWTEAQWQKLFADLSQYSNLMTEVEQGCLKTP